MSSKIFETTTLQVGQGEGAITFEHGKLALQAHGAVTVQCGETIVLVTAVTQAAFREVDFMPLTVNYQEMSYAAGRIPGGYFRREIGRPSDRETLVSRLIDRPIRPLFPDGFRDEVQIIATVISADPFFDPDVLAITGASAAMHISKIPFLGPIAGARIGYIDDHFVINPNRLDLQKSLLNLVVAGSKDAIVMVEGGGNFVSESLMAEAISWAHEQIQPLLLAQEELREKLGQDKIAIEIPAVDTQLLDRVRSLAAAPMAEALSVPEKMARKQAKSEVRESVLTALATEFEDEPDRLKPAKSMLEELEKEIVREKILTRGVRIDGRDTKTVRPLGIETGLLPRAHGSSLFARGETKALCIATLGSTRDEQRIETLTGEVTKRFMLHYNFPPYCVGEAKMLRSPSRREVGHGTLAERALTPVLPTAEDFPFTMRIVSEVMESNGSSSMASVCGASLALMDAGVPVSAPVAGIAMGLIKEGEKCVVLTDILGDEDHLGDMDFKVAGTAEGVTAIQMDIKIGGIPTEVMAQALEQARDARLHILAEMAKVLDKPRAELSKYAPQMEVVRIDTAKIKDVIGPGGKNIKAITLATEASIDIDDSGLISIFAPTLESLAKAKEMVLFYDQRPELGTDYEGPVKKVMDFGAFVEILPGVEGLVHISQLARDRVEQVTDVVREGDRIKVKVIEIEPGGRLRLSRQAVLMEEAGETFDLEAAARPARTGGGGGRRPSGGDNRRGGGSRGPRR
ncbi:MAG: polyribonucleotide nucleotidyltransferase [Deltaproteobacteria bacterium]|nr:polyribonucleotide nucleotidyltransferase [Deltaproteobacteria bacterium]